jgi:plastocyanin
VMTLIGSVVVLMVAAMAAGPVSAETATGVGIENFTFTPAVVTVEAGTTVTWTNRDEELHTVTSSAGIFRSGGLAHDEQFSQVLARPGRYEYFCALHPHMKATVIVK